MQIDDPTGWSGIWSRYPSQWRPKVPACPASSGLSGGQVWKVDCLAGRAALRRWTPCFPAERIGWIHRLLHRLADAGGDFVPVPISTLLGATWFEHDGDRWDLCTWIEGTPIEVAPATDDPIVDGVRRLADWHRGVQSLRDGTEIDGLGDAVSVDAFRRGVACVAPGARRRIALWRNRPTHVPPGRIVADRAGLAKRTLVVANELAPRVDDWLARIARPTRLSLALRDVHREHILFDRQRARGIVDFGAIGIDPLSADLGRWMGSVVPNDDARWRRSLEAAVRANGIDPSAIEFAWCFDRVGTVLGALNWLQWICLEERQFVDANLGYRRWSGLVERLESWR